MFMKKIVMTLILTTSFICQAQNRNQEVNPCEVILKAKINTLSDISKIQSKIDQLKKDNSALNVLKNTGKAAVISGGVASLFPIFRDGPLKIGHVVVVGVVATLGAVVVTTTQLVEFQKKLSELEAEENRDLAKRQVVLDKYDEDSRRLGCR